MKLALLSIALLTSFSLFSAKDGVDLKAEADSEDRFYTNYDTKAESLQAGDELNRKIIEEGITLLKNEDHVLPLKSDAKVSIFGNYSTNLIYNGSGSGSGAAGSKISLQEVFDNAGIQVNNALTNFYGNDSLSGSTGGLKSYTINPGYNIGETPVSKLQSNVSASTYEEYNDAAFIVISRSGMESADLPKGMSTGFTGGKLNGTAISGARKFDDHSLQPNRDEADLIHYVSQYFDNIILLFNTGSQFEVGFLDDPGHYAYSDKIKGAFWIGFPGRGNGLNALGDIITGKVSPSGHTVDTYARDFKLDPTWDNMALYSNNVFTYTNLNRSFVNYQEGIYYGYQYYETRDFTEGDKPYSSGDGEGNKIHNTTTTDWDSWYQSAVVYPLGYGLSYTTFDWEVLSSNPEAGTEITKDGSISVDVKVTNTGSVAGKDVVQLYYTAPYYDGGIEKSYVVLSGYEKTELLAPGESDIVTLSLKARDMASYDYNDANKNGFTGYELDPGTYTLRISKDAHESLFDLDFDVPEGGYQYSTEENGAEIRNLFADAEWKGTEYLTRKNWENTWPHAPTAEERVASQELIDTVNNTSLNDNIIAEDDPSDPWYTDVMPTTGNNSGPIQLEDLLGVPYDDPLWEQFLDQLAVGTKTSEGMVNTIWNAGWYILGIDGVGLKKTHQEDGPSGLDGRQEGGSYTNFCSETVLASTWNKELAYEKGLVIGNQGLFGNKMSVSGIYAPSVNLHRSPFGGRNFEYYSEDPVISGEMAGNITKGCNEKGMITYLKHFAINEHESNRENLLTWANEQTMREIYFRSFEICVKKYQTHGIMSALNSLGGTWTGGNYNLLTNLLRKEWSFDGLIITDYTQGRPQLNANMAIRAGGDIILATSSSQQRPAGLDQPTTVKALRRAMHNICYSTLNYTAIYNKSIVNIMGSYNGDTLSPAIAGFPYEQSVAKATTNDGSDAREVVKYSLKKGSSLPEGLALSEDGTISGTAAPIYESKIFTVVASYEHSTREAQFTLPVVDQNKSVIYTKPVGTSLKTGYIGETYQENVAWAYLANGSDAKITYSLGKTSLLPEGIVLTEDGKLIGTPAKACVDYSFVVTATSQDMYPMSVRLSLTIGQRIAAEGRKLKTGKVNQRYSDSIALIGKRLNYSLKEGAALPEGLRLTPEGTIIGTPTSAITACTFTVVMTGDGFIPAEATYTLDIAISYKTFTPASLKVGKRAQISVNFAIGSGDITYAVVDGTLPEGLELTSDGVLTGTPAKAGNYTVTIASQAEGLISDQITITLNVQPAETAVHYAAGLGIGISAIVLAGAAIIVFFIFFDKKNRKEGAPKIHKSVLIPAVSSFCALGVTLVMCMTFLAPNANGDSAMKTFTFEAEYVDLENFNGAGISNSAEGVNNIYGEGGQSDIDKGWSNGYFLGNTYAENTIEFHFEADQDSTGKLTLRLASELGNMTLSQEAFGIEINGAELEYSIVVANSKAGSYDFADYALNHNLNLVEGENTIRLIIKSNTLQGGNRTGAPLIDCIKVTTEAELTWNPLLDNPDNRGSV